MEITRIGSDKNQKIETDRITFNHGGEIYTITPEYKGFRVHKHSMDGHVSVTPSCANEIIVR